MDDPRPIGEGLQASLDRIEQRLQEHPAPPGESDIEADRSLPATREQAPTAKVDAAGEDLVVDDIGEVAYTPRLFTQLALPYRDPGDIPEWIRRNGDLELIVQPGRVVVDAASGQKGRGYPYGVVPRLLVIWMAGEVINHRRRELLLGPSLGKFLTSMGLTRGGTQAARVRDQMTRLFGATVTVEALTNDAGLIGWTMDSVRVARRATLWWHDTRPQDPLWESTVLLSEEFYESIVDRSVPLDSEALARLRASTRSPMALDIYAWLAHRLWRVKNPTIARWSDLAAQFGGDYGRLRAFKAQFLKDLRHVLAVYPTAKVGPEMAGVRLYRSSPPVPPRSKFSRSATPLPHRSE